VFPHRKTRRDNHPQDPQGRHALSPRNKRFRGVSNRFGASPEDNQLLGFVRVDAKIVPL